MKLTVRSLLGRGYEKVKLVRIAKSHHKACLICGRPDYCSVADNDAFAICMRESAGSIKEARNGGFIHILNKTPRVPEKLENIIEIKKAGSGHLHRVYSHLIKKYLSLTPKHFQHLNIDRGLSEKTIKLNGYVSAPENLSGISASMEKIFGDSLKGVPGFYRTSKGWRLVSTNGIWLPVRDVHGNIRGFQIKQDLGLAKYIWLSTYPEKYKDGTSSGNTLHFAKPSIESDVLLLTEGVLKGDCVSEFIQKPVVALAGVKTVSPENVLKEILSLPLIKKIVICYDADWLLNSFVKSALLGLGEKLSEQYAVFVRTWQGEKGYDDLLFKDREAPITDYSFEDFRFLFS